MFVDLGLGLLVGSILGSLTFCLATRSTTTASFWGRSYCDYCKKTLAWYDLIPIFSYLFSFGRCRYCKAKLSIIYPLVEIFMGILTAYLFYQMRLSSFLESPLWQQVFSASDIIFKLFVLCIMVAVIITDLKTGLIPDRITYPSIVIAFVYLVVISVAKSAVLITALASDSLGRYLLFPVSDFLISRLILSFSDLFSGLIAAFLFALLFISLILITKGRGMGGGDLKLVIFMGLVLGLPSTLTAIMIAFMTGALVGIILILLKLKKFGQTIPFGPFLSIGGIISLFWGQRLLNWYLNLKLQ